MIDDDDDDNSNNVVVVVVAIVVLFTFRCDFYFLCLRSCFSAASVVVTHASLPLTLPCSDACNGGQAVGDDRDVRL